jgi:hypothetical protein
MICENCGKENDGNYGSGRFCCKECARAFSTKNSQGQLKEAKCIECGKIIYIGKRASNKTCRCDDCTTNAKKIKLLKEQHYKKYIKCPICGQQHLFYNKCDNLFCNNHNIQQFKSLIKYFGFDKNKLGTNEVENEFNRVRNILYNLYWVEHKSSADICKIYNYPNIGNLTGKIFHYLGILSKTVKISVKENYIEGRSIPSSNYQYKQQWHTTWNNKEVYLRSSFELDYAKELDEQKINYDVECLHIKYWDSQKQEFRCAIPDFYLPDTNTIIEIKSSWTLDKQNMIDKMKAYKDLGYNFKLICDYNKMIL